MKSISSNFILLITNFQNINQNKKYKVRCTPLNIKSPNEIVRQNSIYFYINNLKFTSLLLSILLIVFTSSVSAIGQSVQNTISGKSFTAIQPAIDDNDTKDGDVLTVSAGTYTENIIINKSLTINGPNAGTAGTGSRVAEAILSNSSINVISSGAVVINGFHIYQTNNTSVAISLGGNSPVTIQNSKIERVGTDAGQTVRAIVTSSGSGIKNIKDNLFTGSTAGGLFSGHKTWTSGIYINGASSTVNVTGNTFENLRAALNLDDYNNGISISGNTFNTNGTHFSFGGSSPTAGSYVMGANNFKAPADGFMNLSNVDNTFRLDITASTWNGVAFSSLPLADLFLVEAGMYHRGRSGRNGLVTYVAGNQYVYGGLTTIQSSINYGTANDIIHIRQGTYNESITVNKNLTFEGANKGTCGIGSRTDETIFTAPATETGVITLSGAVTASFDGIKVDGLGVAYLTQPNQGLVFKNSVFELDFLPGTNNIYAASNSLTLDCNLFKAINGTNDGSASHIFVGSGTLSALNNKFTSEDAITVLTNTRSTTSLPTWFNLTANANNLSVQSNEFKKIDIGILLASNAGNVTIKNNEFSEAKRDAYKPGNGYGTGIAIFGNYTPADQVLIQNNKFFDSETGIRTSTGDASNNFPATSLVTISNNSFVNITNGSFRIGDSYNSSTNKLNAACNWFDNAPIVTGGDNIISNPKLASGTDDDAAIGFQQTTPVCAFPTEFWVNDGSQTGDVYTTAVGNDANPGTQALPFRTINHAISVAAAGNTIFVDAGTYAENVVVDKTLIIKGATKTTTIVQGSGPNSGIGIDIRAADVTLDQLTSDNYNYGITINASGTAHKLKNLKATNNGVAGIAVPYTAENAAISGLQIDNVDATGNSEGLEVFVTLAGSKVFDNVSITNSNFSNNSKKGIYIERANNVIIDGVTVDNSGNDPTNGSNNNGIDFNLKFAAYSGITIQNSTITKSGYQGTAGTAADGPSALTIKARDESTHPTYGPNPATLTGVTIFQNVISGPVNGIRIGEYGKINAGPSNVVIEKNDLSNSAFGSPFSNKAIINNTNSNITIACNWHGTIIKSEVVATFAATGSGTNNLTTVASNSSRTVCIQPVVPTDFYVNDQITTGDHYTTAIGNDANPGTQALPFATINHAISVAAAGNTIWVDAGTYVENVAVNKSLILKGSNFGINPKTGTQLAQSILIPATSQPNIGAASPVSVINFSGTTNGSVIDGFTINGDNPSITSGVPINENTGDVDATAGISAYNIISGTRVSNNVILNVNYAGVLFHNGATGAPTSDNLITANLFKDLRNPTYGGIGAFIGGNNYVSVTNNYFEGVRSGIQTDNYWQADPGNSHTISGNIVEAVRRGIMHNNAYANAAKLIITNNTVTAYPGTTENEGIMISSLQGAAAATVEDNTVSGISSVTHGYQLWNNPTSSTITIKGGTVSNTLNGIFANNYDGYGSNAASSEYIIDGVTINSSEKGIYVKDNVSNTNNATVKVTFKNSTYIDQATGSYGVLIEGNDAQAKTETIANSLKIKLKTTGAQSGIGIVNISSSASTPHYILNGGLAIDLNSNISGQALMSEQNSIVDLQGSYSAPDKLPNGINTVFINGKLWFTNGIFSSGSGSIEFGNAAENIVTATNRETGTSYILGSAIMVQRLVGNNALYFLGVNLPAGDDLNNVIIERITSTNAVTPVVTTGSIKVKWIISPATRGGRTAVSFSFLSTFLNGQDPSALYAYRYNGTIWETKSSALSTTGTDLLTTSTFNIDRFSPWTFGSNSNPLPVSLTEFKAVKQEQTALLTWSTVEETDSKSFDVQHSLNGKNWQTIGTVSASGESKALLSYSFSHVNPANGDNLYRLMMIDRDGTFAYSRIVSINFEMDESITLFPNPAADYLQIKTNDWSNIKSIKLIDLNGRSVYTSSVNLAKTVDLKSLNSGIYIVEITRLNGQISAKKIIINK